MSGKRTTGILCTFDYPNFLVLVGSRNKSKRYFIIELKQYNYISINMNMVAPLMLHAISFFWMLNIIMNMNLNMITPLMLHVRVSFSASFGRKMKVGTWKQFASSQKTDNCVLECQIILQNWHRSFTISQFY